MRRLPQSLSDEKIPRSGNKNSVNFCIKKKREIPGVQCQENIRLCRERRDQNWFIFRCRQEEGALRGEGIRNPLDAGLQVVPVCGGLRRELGEVFYGLGAAIGSGDQVPATLGGEDRDES